MQRINMFLNENAGFLSLSQQALSVAHTQRIWSAVVPEAFKAFTQASLVKHKRLTVYADNGAVAAKIKLMLPSLLTQIQNQGLEVTSIRVEVQVKSHSKRINQAPRFVSERGVESLNQLANQLQGSELAESLKRLAQRGHS